MSDSPRLPDSIRVIERGWLSSNSIVLFDGAEASVIDSGYRSQADQTVALVREVVGTRSLTHLVNTHSHS
ncbi:MAG TPA: MBL fold metallo-hydrolase, partial [Rhodocyclaceae bacterium]|nr:MBL fold metallo-hydrolase [Rhodocyclaceae bacterium]